MNEVNQGVDEFNYSTDLQAHIEVQEQYLMDEKNPNIQLYPQSSNIQITQYHCQVVQKEISLNPNSLQLEKSFDSSNGIAVNEENGLMELENLQIDKPNHTQN